MYPVSPGTGYAAAMRRALIRPMTVTVKPYDLFQLTNRLDRPALDEIIMRLEAALYQTDVGQLVFGGEDIYVLFTTLASLIHGFEQRTGKLLRQDVDLIFGNAAEALRRFLRIAREAKGEVPADYPIRDLVDEAVLAMIQQMIAAGHIGEE